MLRSRSKNAIVVVVWILMLVFTSFLLINEHIPSSYIRTPYTIVSSTYVTNTKYPYYQIKARYSANNGKTYPANLQYGNIDNNGQPYVYYSPGNPAIYKAASPEPIGVDFIPIGVAILVTFLVYSKITFIPTTKKKK